MGLKVGSQDYMTDQFLQEYIAVYSHLTYVNLAVLHTDVENWRSHRDEKYFHLLHS